MDQPSKKTLRINNSEATKTKSSAQALPGDARTNQVVSTKPATPPATARWLQENAHQGHWNAVARVADNEPATVHTGSKK
jgi:hypothetical protein